MAFRLEPQMKMWHDPRDGTAERSWPTMASLEPEPEAMMLAWTVSDVLGKSVSKEEDQGTPTTILR